MVKEKMPVKEKKNTCACGRGTGGGAVYGLGFIGALVYYIQGSHTFAEGLLGFLKAIVWPAFLVYRIHEWLKL